MNGGPRRLRLWTVGRKNLLRLRYRSLLPPVNCSHFSVSDPLYALS